MDKLVVSDSLVERVARDLCEWNRQAAVDNSLRDSAIASVSISRLTAHLWREQPQFLLFISAFTSYLGAESRKMALFLFGVIFESFRLAGRLASPINPENFIIACHTNCDTVSLLQSAHKKFVRRYLENSNMMRQPALIRYITGVLVDGHETCPHQLPEDKKRQVFIILKSVIDVLDQESDVKTN